MAWSSRSGAEIIALVQVQRMLLLAKIDGGLIASCSDEIMLALHLGNIGDNEEWVPGDSKGKGGSNEESSEPRSLSSSSLLVFLPISPPQTIPTPTQALPPADAVCLSWRPEHDAW